MLVVRVPIGELPAQAGAAAVGVQPAVPVAGDVRPPPRDADQRAARQGSRPAGAGAPYGTRTARPWKVPA